MKRLLLLMMMGIFLLGIVSAGLDNQGYGKQNQNFTLTQTCNDATFVTLSTIQYPDRSTSIINTNMTSVGGGAFQYNFTGTSQLGRYDVTGISNGCEKTYAFYFEITPTGKLSTVNFLWLFLAIITLTFILGVRFESEWIVFFGFVELLFFGFFIMIYGIDIFKDVNTTRAIAFIVWGVSIIGIFKAAQVWLGEFNK